MAQKRNRATGPIPWRVPSYLPPEAQPILTDPTKGGRARYMRAIVCPDVTFGSRPRNRKRVVVPNICARFSALTRRSIRALGIAKGWSPLKYARMIFGFGPHEPRQNMRACFSALA